jgi:hypothetical protein
MGETQMRIKWRNEEPAGAECPTGIVILVNPSHYVGQLAKRVTVDGNLKGLKSMITTF